MRRHLTPLLLIAVAGTLAMSATALADPAKDAHTVEFSLDSAGAFTAFPPLGEFVAYTCADESSTRQWRWKAESTTNEPGLLIVDFAMPSVGGKVQIKPDPLEYLMITRPSSTQVRLERYLLWPPGSPTATYQLTHAGAGTMSEGLPPDRAGQCGAAPSTRTVLELTRMTAYFTGVAAVSGGIALGCGASLTASLGLSTPVTGPCTIISGTVMVVSGLGAAVTNWLAGDPPDEQFRTLASPAPPHIGHVRAPQAVNELLAGYANAIGVQRALIHSLERSQGAMAFGTAADASWEQRQRLAAASFADRLAGLLAALPAKGRAAAAALRRAHLDVVLGARAVRRAQSHGLPKAVVRRARRAGVTAHQLAAIRRGAKHVKAGTSLVDAVDPPGLARALGGEAQALRAMAQDLRTQGPPPYAPTAP